MDNCRGNTDMQVKNTRKESVCVCVCDEFCVGNEIKAPCIDYRNESTKFFTKMLHVHLCL